MRFAKHGKCQIPRRLLHQPAGCGCLGSRRFDQSPRYCHRIQRFPSEVVRFQTQRIGAAVLIQLLQQRVRDGTGLKIMRPAAPIINIRAAEAALGMGVRWIEYRAAVTGAIEQLPERGPAIQTGAEALIALQARRRLKGEIDTVLARSGAGIDRRPRGDMQLVRRALQPAPTTALDERFQEWQPTRLCPGM